jgi:hypothetical protein
LCTQPKIRVVNAFRDNRGGASFGDNTAEYIRRQTALKRFSQGSSVEHADHLAERQQDIERLSSHSHKQTEV